jgi:hypothetical protein
LRAVMLALIAETSDLPRWTGMEFRARTRLLRRGISKSSALAKKLISLFIEQPRKMGSSSEIWLLAAIKGEVKGILSLPRVLMRKKKRERHCANRYIDKKRGFMLLLGIIIGI